MISEKDCKPHERFLMFPATISRKLYLSDLRLKKPTHLEQGLNQKMK